MRALFTSLLAFMLTLNALDVAAAGVCIALQHDRDHTAHFGHHPFGDEADDTHHAAGESGKTAAFADHHHTHAHPGFSALLPDSLMVQPATGPVATVRPSAADVVSAPQPRLERPPRPLLA